MPAQKCKVCNSNITPKLHRGLDCVVCNQWFHQKCAELTVANFDKLRENSTRWSCKSCTKKGRRSSFVAPQPLSPITPTQSTSSQPPLPTTASSSDIENLQKQLIEFKETITAQIEKLESQIAEERERHEQQKIINEQLKNKLESLTVTANVNKKKSLEKVLEIRGLPRGALSNPANTVILVSQEINCETHISQFDCKSDTTTITIEFKSSSHRQNFLEAGKTFNRHQRKFNGQYKIFVNEVLTSEEKKLLYETKSFARHNGYKFAWHTRGNVHLKQNENTTPIIIKTQQQLECLKNGNEMLLSEHERVANEDGGGAQSHQF